MHAGLPFKSPCWQCDGRTRVSLHLNCKTLKSLSSKTMQFHYCAFLQFASSRSHSIPFSNPAKVAATASCTCKNRKKVNVLKITGSNSILASLHAYPWRKKKITTNLNFYDWFRGLLDKKDFLRVRYKNKTLFFTKLIIIHVRKVLHS